MNISEFYNNFESDEIKTQEPLSKNALDELNKIYGVDFRKGIPDIYTTDTMKFKYRALTILDFDNNRIDTFLNVAEKMALYFNYIFMN